MIDIKKQYTDDPLLDEIIYDVSLMAVECILKNPTEVSNNETLESLENYNLYESCINKTVDFSMFDYEEEDLVSCPLIQTSKIEYYSTYIDELNDNAKAYLLEKKSKQFMDNYIEMNNYYRMLNGLPDYGTKGLSIARCGVDLTPYGITVLDPKNTYIQDLSSLNIDLLDSEGVLDEIYDKNKKYKYLKYIGKRKIDFHTARQASNFSLLYTPQSSNSEVYIKFLERLDINRGYFISCFYSDAYKLDNDYFDSYMIFLIIMNSMIDMIALSPEYLIKREIFDLRTVEYILESNGVAFFPDIPMKYQKRLVRNLNKLIKYKSSDKNIVDICSLFGFDDIQTFKYYLHKNRNMSNGEYVDKTTTDSDNNVVPDLLENYTLKFIRVPMDGELDDSIRNSENYYNYEDITSQDPTWNGPYNANDVKKKILEQEFNVVRTKYISIDTVTEMTNLAFELPYFINMIMNVSPNDVDISKLSLYCAPISATSTFNLLDIFVYLYSLMYEYYGVEDSILYDRSKILYITGFNFDADLSELATYLANNKYTLKDLGIDGFVVPTKYLSFTQLVNIYTGNKDVYDHVIHCMRHADNKRIYDIYKKIYDSLMISKLNTTVFTLPDGTVASTYAEYLKFKNSVLYSSIMDMRSVSEDTKQDTISAMINNVCDIIHDYLGSVDLRYIFTNLPSISIDYVRKYMEEVIRFFKSYRVSMLNVGSIYKIEDKVDRPTLIDQIFYTADLYYKLHLQLDEKYKLGLDVSYNDNIKPEDKIYIDIVRILDMYYQDKLGYNDLYSYISAMNPSDKINPKDIIYQLSKIMERSDLVIPEDRIKFMNILTTKLDKYTIKDNVYIDVFTFRDLYIDSILDANNIPRERIPIIDSIYNLTYTTD